MKSMTRKKKLTRMIDRWRTLMRWGDINSARRHVHSCKLLSLSQETVEDEEEDEEEEEEAEEEEEGVSRRHQIRGEQYADSLRPPTPIHLPSSARTSPTS